MLSVDAQAYPTLLLIHRDVTPYLRSDLRRGKFRVLTSLESAAVAIAAERGVKVERVFLKPQYDDPSDCPKWRKARKFWPIVPSLGGDASLGFENLNTPEDFAEAEKHSDALET